MVHTHRKASASRRNVLRGLGGLIAAGMGITPAMAQRETMKVGWQPGPYAARYLQARESGLFQQIGIPVEHLKFLAGPPMFAALRSGSLDVAVFADTPAVIILSQGVPLKIVLPENDNGKTQGLVARKGSGIKSLEDLRQKRIAIVMGSSGDYALDVMLRKAKLNRGDVTAINLDVTNLIPAFKKGDIDAAIYWAPWMNQLINAGGYLIATNWDVGIPLIGLMVVRDEWLQRNRAAMTKLVRAWDSVTELIRTRPDEIAGKIAAETGFDKAGTIKLINEIDFMTVKEVLDPGSPYSIAPQSIAAGAGLAHHLSSLGHFLKSAGRIDRFPDFKAIIDPSVAEDVAKGG